MNRDSEFLNYSTQFVENINNKFALEQGLKELIKYKSHCFSGKNEQQR